MVRRKYIRSLVQELLKEHRIRSASVDVTAIAKEMGIEVQATPAEDELSGFLYRDRTRNRAVIGINANQSLNRQHFTTAHELGHFLLHDFDHVHVDRQFKVWLRSEASSQGTDDEEKEANLFAAELLMPAHFLEEDMEEIGALDLLDEKILKQLADKYEVSTHAMTFRLSYLVRVSHFF